MRLNCYYKLICNLVTSHKFTLTLGSSSVVSLFYSLEIYLIVGLFKATIKLKWGVVYTPRMLCHKEISSSYIVHPYLYWKLALSLTWKIVCLGCPVCVVTENSDSLIKYFTSGSLHGWLCHSVHDTKSSWLLYRCWCKRHNRWTISSECSNPSAIR